MYMMGVILATIFVLSCLWQPLFCVFVRLNAVRSCIYTSAWAVVQREKAVSSPGR